MRRVREQKSHLVASHCNNSLPAGTCMCLTIFGPQGHLAPQDSDKWCHHDLAAVAISNLATLETAVLHGASYWSSGTTSAKRAVNSCSHTDGAQQQLTGLCDTQVSPLSADTHNIALQRSDSQLAYKQATMTSKCLQQVLPAKLTALLAGHTSMGHSLSTLLSTHQQDREPGRDKITATVSRKPSTATISS